MSMSWRDAIISVLKEAGRPMTVNAMTQEILGRGLRPQTSSPQRTCHSEAGFINRVTEPGFDRSLVERHGSPYEYEYVGLACDDEDLRIRYDEQDDLIEILLHLGSGWFPGPVSLIKADHMERFMDCLLKYKDVKRRNSRSGKLLRR